MKPIKSPKVVKVKGPNIEKSVSATEVEFGVSTLLAVIENHKKTAQKPQLFKDDSDPIYLQITPFKVPVTPKVELRVCLPHPLSKDKDTCLIVKNIKTGQIKDKDRTILHYQNLLKDIGIKGSIQVIPICQLCDEHKQYEEKGRFAQLYDAFLVDGRLLAVAGRTLGIRFSRAGKHLIPVVMDTKGLKKRLETALSKTAMTVHSKGDTFTMKVAYSTMTPTEISENILSAMRGICQKGMLPGGIENIRSAHVKTARSLAIPILVSRVKHNSVAKPIKKVKLPKAYKVEEGELTTIFGGVVKVNPEGDVHFRKVITAEDRKMLADDDSDALEFDTKEEKSLKSEIKDEKKVKSKPKSKKLKRKLPSAEESDDDEDVEAAEENYINEIDGGFGGDDSDEEKKSAKKAPVAKAKRSKKSPVSKKPKNKKK